MGKMDAAAWQGYAEAFDFIGTALLQPMDEILRVGLDPLFWPRFPHFGKVKVTEAIKTCEEYAKEHAHVPRGVDPLKLEADDYRKLFAGDPHPAVSPAQTTYEVPENLEAESGFGGAAADMQKLLADMGLDMASAGFDLPDHMGVEVMYLSILCRQMQMAKESLTTPMLDVSEKQILAFVERHPGAWVGAFKDAVDAVLPNGYISNLLALEEALLESLAVDIA